MAFLITWVTHNSWLPGDPRGFRSHKGKNHIPPPERYAGRESKSYDPKLFQGLYEFHSRSDAVRLNEEQREVVANTVADTTNELCPGRSVLCVGETHVHVLVELGGRVTTGRFCNYAKGTQRQKTDCARSQRQGLGEKVPRPAYQFLALEQR